jgi:dynein heavy chain
VQESREEIELWQAKFILISEVIDEWLSLQRNWIYLENIFNAQDIQRQLPNETHLFIGVDKFWRENINKTKKFPSVENICANHEFLLRLQHNNSVLEKILKSLD